MKLELNHIAPYLSFKLKFKELNYDDVYELIGLIDNECQLVFINENNYEYRMLMNGGCMKPVLRPISDLTKEIEVNGKKVNFPNLFFPCDEFDEIMGDTPLKNALDYVKCGEILKLNYDWEFWQKLFEWHFDVFGLIEKGLAIDINTL